MTKHGQLFLICFLAGLAAAVGGRGLMAGAPAPETVQAAEPEPGRGLLLDLGNETCPVMGNPVDHATYAEWSHLRVGFCCPGCDRMFFEDPEKALDRLGGDWRAALEAVEAYRSAGPAQRPYQLDKIRERWTVVRAPEEG
jgi:hypothetical protein